MLFRSKFDKYAGLFAEQGDFDIPAAITGGVAFDASPNLTLMFDYQHIFYSGVASISNPSAPPPAGAPFGLSNGPGFGWHDVNVYKVGAEWRANDTWTFRAGYAYSDNPVQPNDVTLNIVAPGVVQHHITAGGSYKLNERDTIEFAGMYVPKSTVSGIEVSPVGANPARTIELNMRQAQLLVGWTRKF